MAVSCPSPDLIENIKAVGKPQLPNLECLGVSIVAIAMDGDLAASSP